MSCILTVRKYYEKLCTSKVKLVCLRKSRLAIYIDSDIHELNVRLGDAGVEELWFRVNGFFVALVSAAFVRSYHNKVAAAKYVMKFHRWFLKKLIAFVSCCVQIER